MKGIDKVLKKLSDYSNHYSDSKFWKKLKSISTRVGSIVVYDALLLFYTLKSSDVGIKDKALICGALGYLILPTDFIPDMFIPLGYTDDIAVLFYVIGLIKKEITSEIESRAKQKMSDLGLFSDDSLSSSEFH